MRSSAQARTGVEAVRTALEYRVAVIQAAAGSGKTTAVRAAVAGRAHIWFDAGTLECDEPLAAASSEDRLIVVDDLHAFTADGGGPATIAALVDRFPGTRWVVVSRYSLGPKLAIWIANGEAGAPVEQSDLSLSLVEIRRAAKTLGVRVDDAAMNFLIQTTRGWPIAVKFALAALQRSPLDLSRAITATKQLLSAYFETEILEGLEKDRRDLLCDLALLGAFDERMLARLGREDPAADLRWLGGTAIPFYEDGQRALLHPLFAQYVVTQIPTPQRRTRVLRAAGALRASGLVGRSFDLKRLFAPDSALAELHAEGLALLDAGCRDGVEEVIRALPQSVRRDDPIVVCLRAELEAQAGALARANVLYEKAYQIATTPEVHARICRHRALHYLNQGKTETLDAILPALEAGTAVERVDARGIYAMALALAGRLDDARLEARRVVEVATRLDDEALLARSLQRMSYVDYQAGNIPDAQRNANEAARLARRLEAWFNFICAQSVLYGTAVDRDDHAAALWHAQQIELAAERTGDRRHRLYALSAQYVLEVERGRKTRALAIEAEMPLHSGFRDELDCCVALATRLSWNREFAEGYRILVTLDDRVVDPSERRLWNAALAMFAAFGNDEKNASLRLRACGRVAAAAARENAIGNVMADCFASIAQIVLGHAEAAVRRLPENAPTTQTRALASFARDLAALGSSLGSESASRALQRLRSARQEGLAEAVVAALASLGRDDASELTEAEVRVLVELADGRTAKAIAQKHGRSIHTVRNQIKGAARKLGASGSIEAVARARRLGLLH